MTLAARHQQDDPSALVCNTLKYTSGVIKCEVISLRVYHSSTTYIYTPDSTSEYTYHINIIYK